MTRFVAAQTGPTQALDAVVDLANQTAQGSYTAVTAATVTLTAAQVINGIVNISGGSTCAVTMPTAAAVVAAIQNCQVGSWFDFFIQNTNSGTATMNGAVTGNTYTGQVVNPLTHVTQHYKGIVTNATAGSEAVTYYGLLYVGA